MNKIVTVSLILTLSACTGIENGTYQNDKIDDETHALISAKNKMLLGFLKKGNTKDLADMMSVDMHQSVHENLDAFVAKARTRISSDNYKEVDAFHVVNENSNQRISIKTKAHDKRNYQLRYQAVTKESFVSILEPHTDGDIYRILLVYGKYKDQWKLNVVQYGRHTIGGIDAIGHYEKAMEHESKGYLTNAVNHMVLASATASPASEYLEYTLQKEMDQYNENLLQQALTAYPMPLTLNDVATKPQVFKIMPQRVEGDFCTMVKYRTSIILSDTIALKAENSIIDREIDAIFPGIKADAPFVFYRAYNEIPKEDLNVPYFGFVKEVESAGI
ncbi:MAG: hypothetical protein WEC59_13560 [Salibacteraceae bacterium]